MLKGASGNATSITNKSINPRENVEIWSPGSGNNGWSVSAVGAATTWQVVLACRGKPRSVRIGYLNPSTTTAFTVDKTTVTATAVYPGTPVDPTGTPVNILTGGAIPNIVPVSASAADYPFGLSDWTAITPIDRTDVTTSYYLIQIRSYVSATSGYYFGAGNSAYPGNSSTGLARLCHFMNGDKIASPTGFTATNLGYHLPIYVEIETEAFSYNVLSDGDSITANGNSDAGAELAGITERAVNIVNAQSGPTGRFLSHMNFGVGSQTIAQFFGRLRNILNTYRAGAVVIPAWTPNSAPSTQAGYDANISIFFDALRRITDVGSVPICWTSPPYAGGSSAVETYRLRANALLRSLATTTGLLVVDFDALVTNNDTPVAGWQNGYDIGDGTHPNSVAVGLFAAALAPVLQSISI